MNLHNADNRHRFSPAGPSEVVLGKMSGEYPTFHLKGGDVEPFVGAKRFNVNVCCSPSVREMI